MIILAIYYTIADIVLLGQCFYYRGFTWKDEVTPSLSKQNGNGHLGEPNETSGLLEPPYETERRESHHSTISASHLSPAVPLLDEPSPYDPPSLSERKPTSRLRAILTNTLAVLMVVAAGVLGWYLSNTPSHSAKQHPKHPKEEELSFSLWGQIFGYFCAVLYLGSRIPQILLNYRRKSTEGVSILFFLFACIGNLTYVLSIFAYEPHCTGKHGSCAKGEATALYGRYILVNASWLAGSLGTLLLDGGIFCQFFLYRAEEDGMGRARSEEEGGEITPRQRDQRPLLDRGDSGYQ